MTTIQVDYGSMAAGHAGLVATWGRIEALLAELEATVAATTDMRSAALEAYGGLAARWSAAAEDRQHALKALADAVDRAAEAYRQADATAAARFRT